MKLTSEQKQFIASHETEDVCKLALRFSGADMPFLLAQIAGRQIARQKIPTWYANPEIVYPPHLSLEQASSEATARYKRSLLPVGKRRFVDLTGGMGVDFSFLSASFTDAVYVEQNPELCRIASHNFSVLGLKNATVQNVAAELFLRQTDGTDVVYIDPSRRNDAGHKVFRIQDCTPNVAEIGALLLEKSDAVWIKYSPMLDISLAVKTLESVRRVYVISVDNECKELLFELSCDGGECAYHAVNLMKNGRVDLFSFCVSDKQAVVPQFAALPGEYLYEPNASVLKAGAFNTVSTAFGVKKIHRNSHLYTSDELVADFPGRIFRVRRFFAPNKKNIRSLLSETGKANISVRNFPASVAEIRRQSGLKEGGDVYLFATTLADESKVWVVCEKVSR